MVERSKAYLEYERYIFSISDNVKCLSRSAVYLVLSEKTLVSQQLPYVLRDCIMARVLVLFLIQFEGNQRNSRPRIEGRRVVLDKHGLGALATLATTVLPYTWQSCCRASSNSVDVTVLRAAGEADCLNARYVKTWPGKKRIADSTFHRFGCCLTLSQASCVMDCMN